MATHKRSAHDSDLFGMAGARPEWEQQREDARAAEIEKTQRLREMRLAAQKTPAPKPPVPARTTARTVVKPRRISRAS